MTEVIHMAGIDVHIGPQVRQRCAWCGDVLIDEDERLLAFPDTTPVEDRRVSTWPIGALVAVSKVPGFKGGHLVEQERHEDGTGVIPKGACFDVPNDPSALDHPLEPDEIDALDDGIVDPDDDGGGDIAIIP